MNKWKGCIVEESLDDNRVLNNLETVAVRITQEENSEQRWHIYNALLTEDDIERIHPHLKQGWYLHVWNEKIMIILFKGKKFMVDANDKKTWKKAIDYGLSCDIPEEQLDFIREF